MNKRIVLWCCLVMSLLLAPSLAHARYLNANTGRFTARDSFEGNADEPPSLHKYVYSQDNPINLVDPTGHSGLGGSFGINDTDYFSGFDSFGASPFAYSVAGSPVGGHITIHIWSYRGKSEAWGHASMTLKDGTHISWWPAGEPRERMPLLPNVYSAPANEHQTFAEDVRLEEQPPDVEITITTLNESKIKTWWSQFNLSHKWKTLSQNCSTTVADGLKAGDSLHAKGIWGTIRLQWTGHNLIWTPADVEAFARAIVKYHKP